MASNIDATQPPATNPTTAAMRANMVAAKAEIDALQMAVLQRFRLGHRLGNVMTKTPFSKMIDTAFSTTTGAQAFTTHIESALESAFDAVRFILPNNTNEITGLIGKCAVAAAAGLDPAGNMANADGLTQNNAAAWSSITWNGVASTTWAAGISAHRPAYSVTDWAAKNSKVRTDALTQSELPLLFHRFAIPLSAGVVNIPQIAYGTGIYAQSGFTGNWANDVSSSVTQHRIHRSIFQNTDAVTTPGNLSQNTLQCGIPSIIQYATRRIGLNVMIVADSVGEGSSPAESGVSSTRAWGWAHRAVYALSTPDFPIELANLAWGGQNSAQYTQRLIDLLKLNDADGFPVFRPDVLIYSPFCINDGTPTAAIIASQAAQTAKVLALCHTLNILPILYTGSLLDSLSLADDAYRSTFTTQLKAMGTNGEYIVIDTAGIWGTGATPDRWASGLVCSDGMHPSDAGKDAAAALLQTVLSFIMAGR